MKVKDLILGFSLMLAGSFCYPQDNSNKLLPHSEMVKPEIDSVFILHFERKFSAGLFTSYVFTSFDIDNQQKDNVSYSPSGNYGAGIFLSYDKLRVSYVFKIPNPETIDTKYGKTKYTYFNLTHFVQNYAFEGYYAKFKGFYLNEPEKYNLTSNPYPQRNDLQTLDVGVNLYYIFSNKYSLKAAFIQTEKQNKSRGSFLIMLSYNHSNIKNDSTLIPTQADKHFPEIADFKRGTFNSLLLSPGYGYTYLYRNFFISPVLFWGIGYQLQNYVIPTGSISENKRTMKFNSRFVIGYNAEKAFVTFSSVYDLNLIKIGEIELSNNTFFFKVAVGLRF